MLRLRDMIRLLADQNLAPLADAMIETPTSAAGFSLAQASGWDSTTETEAESPWRRSCRGSFGDAEISQGRVAIQAWTRALFPALDQQDTHVAAGQPCQRS